MSTLNPTIEIPNPVSPRRETTVGAASRLRSLDGMLVGLLHNGKPGGAEVLQGIQRALSLRYENLRFEYRRKPHASTGAAFLPSLFDRWDAAVVALGD
jgi:hypothetical protein